MKTFASFLLNETYSKFVVKLPSSGYSLEFMKRHYGSWLRPSTDQMIMVNPYMHIDTANSYLSDIEYENEDYDTQQIMRILGWVRIQHDFIAGDLTIRLEGLGKDVRLCAKKYFTDIIKQHKLTFLVDCVDGNKKTGTRTFGFLDIPEDKMEFRRYNEWLRSG